MIDSHHLTSRFHLRSEGNILALVTQEGKDCFLYRKMFRDDLFDEAKLAQSFSRHDFGRQFRERNADGLAHEWDGARSEERRVGKECRTRRAAAGTKKKRRMKE